MPGKIIIDSLDAGSPEALEDELARCREEGINVILFKRKFPDGQRGFLFFVAAVYVVGEELANKISEKLHGLTWTRLPDELGCAKFDVKLLPQKDVVANLSMVGEIEDRSTIITTPNSGD